MASKLGDIFSGFDDVINGAKSAGLEEVLSKTRTFTEEVSKKSAERLELSRKKVEVLDVKAKLARAYEKFGRVQYNAFKGEEVSDEAINDIANEIDVLNDRLERINAEIEAQKNAQSVNSDSDDEIKVEFAKDEDTTVE